MKKYLAKIFLALLLGGTLPGWLQGQISYGGTPPSFMQQNLRVQPVMERVENSLDIPSLQQEEDEAAALGLPPRLGVTVPVNFNLGNSGDWNMLSDSTLIWRLGLQMPGALATIVSYDEFYLPEGFSLFLYTPDHNTILGAFGHETHRKGGSFSTGLLPGESVVLELVAPRGYKMEDISKIQSEVKLQLGGVAFCYNRRALTHIPGFSDNAKYGESEPCTININCEDGADWQLNKKSVCKMFMYVNYNWYLCTGTLVNNTAQNIRPFIMSAYHCLSEGDPSTIDFNQWQFIFDYEAPGCEDAEPLEAKTMVGCIYRAGIPMKGGSDGLLLELQQEIPEEWGVYYSGWDRRDMLPVDTISGNIHHPAGDIKKISILRAHKISMWPQYGKEGDTNAHFEVLYAPTKNGWSITEGGSSGSGMFNTDKYLVGTLTGGNASCDYPQGSGFYGRLWYHWNQFGSDSTTQFAYWLDPIGSGEEVLAGTYIDPLAPRIDPSRDSLAEFRTDDYMQPSVADTFSVKVSNLYEPIKIWTVEPFQVSGNGVDFDMVAERDGSGPVYVRYNPMGIRRDTAFIYLCSSGSDTVVVRVLGNSCRPLQLEPSDLPYAQVEEPYEVLLEASGSDASYIYEMVAGELPEGISLNEEGLLSGIPLEHGLFKFTVRVSEPFLCDQLFDCSLYVGCTVVDNFPFQEGFEDGEIPSCWTQEMDAGQVSWQIASGVGNVEAPINASFEGGYNALFRAESYDGYRTKLITPQLDLSDLDNPHLKFAYAQPVWVTDQDLLSVYVKNSPIDPWKELISFQGDVSQWKDTLLSLPDPSAEYFIAFEGLSMFGYGVVIDEVSVFDRNVESDNEISFKENTDILCNNPVTDRLIVQWADLEIQEFRLYTAGGLLIGKYPVDGKGTTKEIYMEHLPSGIYILQARNSFSNNYLKIIKR